MDTSSTESGAKKVVLEELSKEDLIKKCRSLLIIAQKAKQNKEALIEENNKLKQNSSVTDELIENLTQQKLNLVSDLEELRSQRKVFDERVTAYQDQLNLSEGKISDLDTENISYKRQVTRLTDENEQLLEHLGDLERQIEELKSIGMEQNEQLLQLEKNNTSLTQNTVDNKEVAELQNMLSVSLEEVKKLKAQNEELNKSIEHNNSSENLDVIKTLQNENEQLKNEIPQNSALEKEIKTLRSTLNESAESIQLYQQEIETLNKVIEKHTNTADDLNTEIHKNRAYIQKLKQDIANMTYKLSDSQIVSSGLTTDLQNTNEKMKDKLKLYHSKIVKFACDVKKLRESKEYILKNFKMYNKQVNSWKEQLQQVTLRLSTELKKNEDEKLMLNEENGNLKEKIADLEKTLEQLRSESDVMSGNKELNNAINVLTQEIEEWRLNLENNKREHANQIETMCLEHSEKINNLSHLITNYESDKQVLEEKITIDNQNSEKLITDLKNKNYDFESKLNAANNSLEEYDKSVVSLSQEVKRLQDKISTETKLAEQSGQEIMKLAQENRELQNLNANFKEKILELENNVSSNVDANVMEEQISSLKRENGELLAEMNEMNQVLKERGETISKQQAYCDEVIKKISVFETQANKNDDTISQNLQTIKDLRLELKNKEQDLQQMQAEISALKDKLCNANDSQDSNYAESENLSTSTISRSEEASRLKDLEGSWEERYGKLRTLALKLKSRIKELSTELAKEQAEKSEIQNKLTVSVKTVQTIQSQCDKLQDDLDTSKKENKTNLKLLDNIRSELTKERNQIKVFEETISKSKSEIDTLNKEKLSVDMWKKQVGAKVQSLKKELEANTVLKKDFESRIQKLTQEVEQKEKQLKEEREKHLQTRNSLQESNTECKKQSVLNLEMQDYERGIKEMSQKLEKKNELVTKLKNQIDAQKSTVSAVKEQNRLLDERVNAQDVELDACRIEINTFKKNINDLEAIITEKDAKIQDVFKSIENIRSENEELGTQLSKVIAEHQKINSNLKEEKDLLRSENMGLQQRLREIEDKLKLNEEELGNVQNEYQGYKVRAQSVLRQNQARDVGAEEKLTEKADSLRAQVDILRAEIDELKSTTDKLTAQNDQMVMEKGQMEVVEMELKNKIEDFKMENEKLANKYHQTVSENAETVRSLRVHADTLAQCYRQQISEQEVRHNREIIELQSKIDKCSTTPEFPSLILPTTPREEGEGSESVDSTNGNIHPLEKLLGTDQDQEISLIKKQLVDNESKVLHLTALLADTEQDLAKHIQMNTVLKEEIRRQQRSVEREKHAENLEYMKNVVFKFITLNNGDERQRLVPVLNTILKLSPEETHKLNVVAKGDKSWSNYLPLWSASTSKPQ